MLKEMVDSFETFAAGVQTFCDGVECGTPDFMLGEQLSRDLAAVRPSELSGDRRVEFERLATRLSGTLAKAGDWLNGIRPQLEDTVRTSRLSQTYRYGAPEGLRE